MNLDIIRAYNDEMTRIMLEVKSKVVQGCVMHDTAFSGTVTWNDPLTQIADAIKGGLSQAISSKLGNLAGGMAKAVMDASPQTFGVHQTVKSWVASTGPNLTLPILFLATDIGQDVREDVNAIMEHVWPTGWEPLNPPGGYQNSIGAALSAASGNVAGTISIKIGKWFSCVNMMLIYGDPVLVYSKEVTPRGNPLWASMTITFMPYRAINFDDWKSFFPGTSTFESGMSEKNELVRIAEEARENAANMIL